MSIRKDCLHYHEEPYMGARVDCCLAETASGPLLYKIARALQCSVEELMKGVMDGTE